MAHNTTLFCVSKTPTPNSKCSIGGSSPKTVAIEKTQKRKMKHEEPFTKKPWTFEI